MCYKIKPARTKNCREICISFLKQNCWFFAHHHVSSYLRLRRFSYGCKCGLTDEKLFCYVAHCARFSTRLNHNVLKLRGLADFWVLSTVWTDVSCRCIMPHIIFHHHPAISHPPLLWICAVLHVWRRGRVSPLLRTGRKELHGQGVPWAWFLVSDRLENLALDCGKKCDPAF